MIENELTLCNRCQTSKAEIRCFECGNSNLFCRECDIHLHSMQTTQHKREFILFRNRGLLENGKSNISITKSSDSLSNYKLKDIRISCQPKSTSNKIEDRFNYYESDNKKKSVLEKDDLDEKNIEFLSKIEDIRRNFDMNCNELKNKIEENDFQSKNKFNILLTEKLSDYNKLLRIKEEEIFYLRNKVCILQEILEKGKNKAILESERMFKEYKQKYHDMFIDLQQKLKESNNKVENLLLEKQDLIKSFQEDKIKLVHSYENLIER